MDFLKIDKDGCVKVVKKIVNPVKINKDAHHAFKITTFNLIKLVHLYAVQDTTRMKYKIVNLN